VDEIYRFVFFLLAMAVCRRKESDHFGGGGYERQDGDFSSFGQRRADGGGGSRQHESRPGD